MTKLTIGFATYQDYHGAYFTIQSVRIHHPEVLDRIEFVVVDQTESSHPHQKHLENLVQGWVGGKYLHLPEPKGTSPSRNAVFDLAETEYVLCMDSHVLLYPGALKALLDYYDEHPECNDLIQGPMIYDNLVGMSTHMDPVWRSEMYGIWGSDDHFINPDNPPKEIPMHGLGLFSSRKEAWEHHGTFNRQFREFGGEEGYIHEKYRQAGHKTIGLPKLKWLHRFGRPDGARYPLTRRGKVRNYILGWKELGKDLGEVHNHFCKELNMPQREWEIILRNVEKGESMPPEQPEPCNTCPEGSANRVQPPDDVDNIDALVSWGTKTPRDLNQHIPKLAELTSKCSHVTEFATRRESLIGLVGGRPDAVVSYCVETDDLQKRIHQIVRSENEESKRKGKGDVIGKLTTFVGDSLTITDIEETDLLFLDTDHNGKRLWTEMAIHLHKVRRFLVLHDTELFGEKGDDGEAGLLAAVRRLVKEQPEWSVVYHTDKQYGLTVLSKDERDKPKLPSKAKQAWNYSVALSKHLLADEKHASKELIQLRLDTCEMCPQRNEDRCAKCGCYLLESPQGAEGKALWKESQCPFGFWKKSEEAGKAIMPTIVESE